MTTPSDYAPCPGTSQPGTGYRDPYGVMTCPVCRRRSGTTKAGRMTRHADAAWWDSKRKVS